MNSRYLWDCKQIMEGQSDIIWGLLDDVWYFYHNKVSPNDLLHMKKLAEDNKKINKIQAITDHQDSKLSPLSIKRESISVDYISPDKLQKSTELSRFKDNNKSPFSNNKRMIEIKTMIPGINSTRRTSRTYAQIHSKSPNRSSAKSTRRRKNYYANRHSSSKINTGAPVSPLINKKPFKFRNSFLIIQLIEFPPVSEEMEILTRNWLKSLNLTVLAAQETNKLVEDPYRNGLLLCEVYKKHNNS